MTQELSTPNARSSPIDWLFGELYGMYGNQFLDKFRSGHIVDDVDTGIENMKIVWTEKIRSRHMTMGELKRGLSACDRVKFPPSWSEFLELCKPSVDPLTAYYEAVAGVQARAAGEMGTWSHPAIYWAAMPLAFDLGTQSYSQIKGRWERALSEQMDRGEWESIPVPMLQIEAPGKGKLSKEGAAKMIDNLNAAGVLEPKTDHTYWYRNILAREKKGDRTLTMIQKKFAHEAAEAHGYQL